MPYTFSVTADAEGRSNRMVVVGLNGLGQIQPVAQRDPLYLDAVCRFILHLQNERA
ncbi:MAG: hypothetical protein HY033_12305 [Ignavibacteriae bacterium]|nr:hypothetical protein [Ignavibacteria bacterium]MBI3365674.1 hypothetical protein [Ignavibacteriota bacterium]